MLTTAGTPEKREFCTELGADVTIDYRDQDFVAVARDATGGRGVDVILDNMGASYLGRNVTALAVEGRLVVIGMQGGTKAELDLGRCMRKRAAVIATTLRARPVGEKSAICRGRGRARLAAGRRRHRPRRRATARFPLSDAAGAHRRMESGDHIGKIVLVA